MYLTPTGRVRTGDCDFVPVPQIDDATDDYTRGEQGLRKWTPKDFRRQVQQVLRRRDREEENVRNSPSFSDTTFVGDDYSDVPFRRYEEVEIGDYVEYHNGYYGPEASGLSPTSSTEAGLGLEVLSVPVASKLSPGGLCVDDPLDNISYHGSGGETEDDHPSASRNFKPPVLRKVFLFTLLLTLIVLVILAEVAIQLLPNDPGITISSQVYENATNTHIPSILTREEDLSDHPTFRKRQNTTYNTNPPTLNVVPDTISTTISVTMAISSSSSLPKITTSVLGDGPTESLTTYKTELSTPSITISDTTRPSAIKSSSTSSYTLPPLATTPSEGWSSPTLISSATSSPSFTLPLPLPSTPSQVSSSKPSSEPGTQNPTWPYGSSSISTSTITPILSPPPPTDSDTTTSKAGNPWPWPTSDHPSGPGHPDPPTKPGNQKPPGSISLPTGDGTSPTFTPPTTSSLSQPAHSSSTSLTRPPFSWSTDPDPTLTGPILTFPSLTLPTLTLPTLTLPTLTLPPSPRPPPSTPSSKSNPHPTPSVPFQSSTDSPEPTMSLSRTTRLQTTSSNPPGNSPSSASSDPPVTSTERLSSKSSSNLASSTTTDIPFITSDSMSKSFSSSHSALPTTSSTIIRESFTKTKQPPPTITITISPDDQSTPPPTTTTIVTSMIQDNGVFLETTLRSVIHPIKADLDDELTKWITTYTDQGGPAFMETILEQRLTSTVVRTDDDGNLFTYTIVDLTPPRQTTRTDYQGRATTTQDYYLVSSAQVLYDDHNRPTATRTLTISEVPIVTTLFNSDGKATETKTQLVPMSLTTTKIVKPTSKATPKGDNPWLHIVPISDGKYFSGLMLPTLISSIISIPIRMLDQIARLYQPFHALASARGAQAHDSICFQTASIWNLRARARSLLNGQFLLTLTGLMMLGSVVLIPLSSETVRIILNGPGCVTAKADVLTCEMTFGAYLIPAQISVAILVSMIVLTGMVMLTLRKYDTGVDRNPWSLYNFGHLVANAEIRTLLLRRFNGENNHITNKEANIALAGIPFCIDYWKDNGELKYGVLISNETRSLKKERKSVTFGKGKTSRRRRIGNSMPFFILTWTGRLLFLMLICTTQISLLVLIITGEGQGNTQFLMGRWRVVRFILVGAGVLITFIWGSFFYAVAFLSPHKLLRRIRLYNGEAMHMTPPTNPFSGIRSSLTPGRRDVYLAIVSATSILSEILPMLLSVTLDKSAEKFRVHTICLWMTVSVLSISIFTVAGSFFVTWPTMPIDPSTVAGGMYYALTNFVSMSPSSGLLLGRANRGLV